MNVAINYPIAASLSIDEKINVKVNVFYHYSIDGAMQMLDTNRLCLAPYYQDKLNKQLAYLRYRETIPAWVKKMEQH